MATEYRIEFTIQRIREGIDTDFIEIGFGSSGAWSGLSQCLYQIESGVTHGEWETVEGMPDPDDVMQDQP
jgi:hypothetical protein